MGIPDPVLHRRATEVPNWGAQKAAARNPGIPPVCPTKTLVPRRTSISPNPQAIVQPARSASTLGVRISSI